MKFKQKLLLSLTFFIAVLGILLLGPHRALAYVATSPDQIKNATFSFSDAATINSDIGGQPITFTAKGGPTDPVKYVGQGYDCFAEITYPGLAWSDLIYSSKTITSSTQAKVDIDYNPNQTKCTNTNPNSESKTVGNPELAKAFYKQDGSSISPVLSDNGFPDELIKHTYTSSGGNIFFRTDETTCVDRILVSGSQMTLFILDPNQGIKVDGNSLGLGDLGNCKVWYINEQAPQNAQEAIKLASETWPLASNSTGVDISGQQCDTNKPAPSGYICFCPPGGTGGCQLTSTSGNNNNNPPGPAGTTGTCESNSNIGLEWIVCPVLRGMDEIVVNLYGFVEDQLCFSTTDKNSTSSSAGAVSCNSGNNLTQPVHNAWSIMKNLTAAILVIVMLIMVISQAFGTGPFDAYTVRKLLPKMVAAAILIQVSWFLAKWLVDISNDVGKGIASLMYAPFGPNVSDINHALAGIGATGAIVGFSAFAGFAALVAFSGLTVVGILIIALSGLAAILVGFLVLLFRKVLILLTIITIPLAFVAWIVPGGDKYWKLWRENFLKLLAMFPLIMVIIAAGRIFGTIVSQAGSSNTGTTGEHIVALFAVLVGFFGPLFILPKTFKWGGTALNGLGGALVNSTKGLRKKPMEYGLAGARATREQRQLARAERLGEGKGRRWDAILAGSRNYTLGRQARIRRMQDTREKGRKAAEETALRQIIGSEYERSDHPQKLTTLDNVAQGKFDPKTGIDGSNPAAQRWALDELAKFGDWDRITSMRDGRHIDERAWQMFVAKNIGLIHQQAPHLSPQREDLSKIGYQDFATMKPAGFEEYERQFTTGTDRRASDTTPVPSLDPTAKKIRMVQSAKRALADERVLASVDADSVASLQRIANSTVSSPEMHITTDPLGNPTVGRDRRPDGIFLPDETSIATNPASLVSIDSHLAHSNPAIASATREELGKQLGSGDLGTPAQDALEAHLGELKIKAGTSRQAQEIYNQVINRAHQELVARVQRTEQDAVSRGLTPTQIADERARVQGEVSTARARMVGRGLTPY